MIRRDAERILSPNQLIEYRETNDEHDYDFGKNLFYRFDPPPIVRRRPRSPSRLRPSGLRNPADSGAKSLLLRAAYRRCEAQVPLGSASCK